jgi:hypothetical protein
MSGAGGHDFYKPRHNAPTCHIMLGNCSPTLGVPEATITELLAPYGLAAITLTGKSHVFASFSSPEAAAAALHGLDGKPCPVASNRTLVARYAEVRERKVGLGTDPLLAGKTVRAAHAGAAYIT